MTILEKILNATYQPILLFWERKKTAHLLSAILVFVFVLSMCIALINNTGIIKLGTYLSQIHFLQAVEISFTLLLFFEMISLVFVIPQSIANSIGKQIEILSLVLLRSSFKEFSHYNFDISILSQLPSFYKMVSDGVGSLLVFILLSVYYGYQRHRSITAESDKKQFVLLKQLIALFVLLTLLIMTVNSLYHLFKNGIWVQTVERFYLILIFADLLFMLVAFKYTLHYPDIFRYSAFVLVTVFIRFSLLAPVYYNAVVGIFAVVFAIAVVYAHNLFAEGRLRYIDKK